MLMILTSTDHKTRLMSRKADVHKIFSCVLDPNRSLWNAIYACAEPTSVERGTEAEVIVSRGAFLQNRTVRVSDLPLCK